MEMIFSSSVLTGIVILLRQVFGGRVSRRLRYALWFPVMLRLLIPFPLTPSSVSLMNAVDLTVVEQAADYIRVPVDLLTAYKPEEKPAENADFTSKIADSAQSVVGGGRVFASLSDVLETAWACGATAVGIWFITVNVLFYSRLRKRRIPYEVQRSSCKLPVYTVELLPSPCLFGIFRPSVYLTPAVIKRDVTTKHVIAHELCHYSHCDHIWSFARGLCLAIHWFNPLVWMAAAMSQSDCELACDEGVLVRLGGDSRISYGRTLVDMIASKPRQMAILCAGTTMTSGKKGIKERIDLIIKNPKTYALPLVVTLLIVVAGVGCTFTGAPAGELAPSEPLPEVLPGANPTGALGEKIEAGLRNSNPVIRQAWLMIQEQIESSERTSREIFADKATKFTDAEITTLKLVDSRDDIGKGSLIEVYSLRFRMRPEDPSKVFLPGGMAIQDGWLLSQGSMGEPYLVVRSSPADLTFLGTVYPEPGFGVLDAALELLYRLELRKDPSLIAASPIEITRAFALDDVSLTPEEAAERFALRFMDALREDESDLANPQYKTFVVSDYKDVTFKVYPADEAPNEYRVSDSEKGEQSWIVEIFASYQYKGTISPIGDGRSIPADQWVTQLYQGSSIGFLMKKDGDNYTFRSRYAKPD